MGRALGYGARHAAKTMMKVVDAATTPDPSPNHAPARSPAPQQTAPQQFTPRPATPQPSVAARIESARQAVAHSGKAVTRARRSIFAPFRDATRSLWLQVTGVFFVLVAAVMAEGMWIHRAAIHLAPTSLEAQKFYVEAIVFVLFAYFSITSFLRAGRSAKAK